MIRFRKIYHRIEEHDYGSLIESIVLFEKRAERYKAVVLSREEAIEKGFGVEQIVTQYKYFLRIDLWLIVISFMWEGKNHD